MQRALQLAGTSGPAFAATLLALAAAALATASAGAADNGSADPDNWTQYHRTSSAWRYSPLEQIDKASVKRLKAAWIHQPGDITSGLVTRRRPVWACGPAFQAPP
jgi:alcohol dehydrogenase (cytochrome c)